MTDDNEWNDGYITEGCDRCHTIMVMLDELLLNHPSVKKADAQNIVDQAAVLIMAAYKKIGDLDD